MEYRNTLPLSFHIFTYFNILVDNIEPSYKKITIKAIAHLSIKLKGKGRKKVGTVSMKQPSCLKIDK